MGQLPIEHLLSSPTGRQPENRNNRKRHIGPVCRKLSPAVGEQREEQNALVLLFSITLLVKYRGGHYYKSLATKEILSLDSKAQTKIWTTQVHTSDQALACTWISMPTQPYLESGRHCPQSLPTHLSFPLAILSSNPIHRKTCSGSFRIPKLLDV